MFKVYCDREYVTEFYETISRNSVDFCDEHATVAPHGFVELLIAGRRLQTECLVMEKVLPVIDLLIGVDLINKLDGVSYKNNEVSLA